MNFNSILFSLILATIAISNSSCSRLDVMVRFADLYAMNEADKFFDLTSEQSKELKPEVQRVLKEIQTQDFPVAATFLEEVEAELSSKGLSRPQLDAWFTKTRAFVTASTQRFEPLSLSLVKGSSEKQQKHFEEEAREKIEDLREDTSTPAKILKKDRKQLSRWVDMLIGDLNREQENELEAFLKEYPMPYPAMIQYREGLLQDYLKLPADQRADWVKRLIRDPVSFRTSAYKAALLKREEGLKNYVLKLWATLTPKQKVAVSKNLKAKAVELRSLSLK